LITRSRFRHNRTARKLMHDIWWWWRPRRRRQVINKLLSIVPSARGTAREALAMPFFTGGEAEERMDLSDIPLSHEYLVKRLQSSRASEPNPNAAEKNRRMSIDQRTFHSSTFDAQGKFNLKRNGAHTAQGSKESAPAPGVPTVTAEWRKQRGSKRRATMVPIPLMPKLPESGDQTVSPRSSSPDSTLPPDSPHASAEKLPHCCCWMRAHC
jgi:hypothetical protein